MFERYTEKARRAIFFARYETSQFGAAEITPEHLLLGIVREDKSLLRAFLIKPYWLSVDALRREIERRVPVLERISTPEEIPFSQQTKHVLAYAQEEADKLAQREIRLSHLLLGILRDEECVAAQVLFEQGLRISEVRDKVRKDSSQWDSSTTELNLSDMGLKEVPEDLRRLEALRKLDLSRNRLTRLPEFIGQLSNLKYIDLSENALASLPDSLISLTSLRVLYLHGNEELKIPAEILGPPRGSASNSQVKAIRILEYYYRVRGAQGRRPLNEAKLILVGRGGVGKTSIVNRLVYDRFRDEKSTDGIQITKWSLRLNTEENIRLNIWDFGGQEILHATHQFFLTRRTLYLLVLTGREGSEDADAEYWLKLIESFGDDSPVIIVLNKSKEYPVDVNRRGLRLKFPNIRHFISTDCEDNSGFLELRAAIQMETNLLEDLRVEFPENWFAIKERLAAMKTNYLAYNEYRRQCSRLGESDAAAQEALSQYLHNLGVTLNYKDDPRLQDTHVLNPHWVTNGIYSILSSEQLKQNRGEIHLADLRKILRPANYPIKMHRFLMDLMKRFELCFSFPDDDCHFLVPELLDKQEPEEGTNFRSSECLNFQYHYSVLPEGLLPRFIVRTHVLSEGLPRWRSGVVLSFEGNQALVKADIQDKKVLIFVSGPLGGRRRLLAVIRSDFEHIHNQIRNLQPHEMVALPEHPDVLVRYDKLLAMESAGLDLLPEVAEGKIVKLSVSSLLNGVDLEGARVREILIDEPLSSVKVFCSYSRKDESLRNELDTHLKLMQRQGVIKVWHDRDIDAGEDWKAIVDENLEKADIVLLLVSADFIASDYCYAKEMKRALKLHENGAARVIPIIVRDVNLEAAPFAGLQSLPIDRKAITLWADRDSAWKNVSEGVQKVAQDIVKKKVFREDM